MLWDVPVNFHKKVNLTALVAYAQTNNDRRPDLLEAYIARHRRDGLIVSLVISPASRSHIIGDRITDAFCPEDPLMRSSHLRHDSSPSAPTARN